MSKVTKRQAEKATAIIAAWLGKREGLAGPVPVGPEAAYRGQGPNLVMDASDILGGSRRPALIVEGLGDWALEVSCAEDVCAALRALGVWTEPYSTWALCLYRLD